MVHLPASHHLFFFLKFFLQMIPNPLLLLLAQLSRKLNLYLDVHNTLLRWKSVVRHSLVLETNDLERIGDSPVRSNLKKEETKRNKKK